VVIGAYWFDTADRNDGRAFVFHGVPDSQSVEVAPGGVVTTDVEGDGATALDPIETTVITPQAGVVTIQETVTSLPAPVGYQFFDIQVIITAPQATVSNPLQILFLADASVIAGQDPLAVQLYRNGLLVEACEDVAVPDPCIASRTVVVGGDLLLEVFTSAASVWSFGVLIAPVPAVPVLGREGALALAVLLALAAGLLRTSLRSGRDRDRP
jgi:hypothetical protein